MSPPRRSHLAVGGVRLHVLGGTGEDHRCVRHQTGWAAGSAADPPDVVLRFVPDLADDALAGSPPLRLVGVEHACTQDAVVCRAPGPGPARRVHVPLARRPSPWLLTCESGASTVPLLLDVLNVAALRTGLLPLHAGAFLLGGAGSVVTGWSKGGKTETVLGVMAQRDDAAFVGDEWVYVEPESGVVHGSAHPVRVWAWHLDQLPALRAAVPARQLRRLDALSRVRSAHRRAAARAASALPVRVASALMPVLEQRHGAYLEPDELFGQQRVVASGRLDRLVHVESWQSDRTEVRQVSGREVADRMAVSLQTERADLTRACAALRYVHPDADLSWEAAAQEVERSLLHAAFDDAPAVEVRHPYPVDIADLARHVLTGAVS